MCSSTNVSSPLYFILTKGCFMTYILNLGAHVQLQSISSLYPFLISFYQMLNNKMFLGLGLSNKIKLRLMFTVFFKYFGVVPHFSVTST